MTLFKDIRDHVVLAATFWKREVVNAGVRLTLRNASTHVRYSMMMGYELEDARLARKTLAPGDRVLELGSAIGFMAIYCRTQLGISDYAMVEANPGLLPLIADNFALNGTEAPLLFNFAAGANDGEARFSINRDYMSSSTIRRANTTEEITVPQRSISSIVAMLPFRPNVLIIDIEGGEAEIPIEHWLGFDKIIGEFHERLVGDASIRRITDALLAHGYVEVGKAGHSRAYIRQSGTQ